jgi:hypothetical protein
MNRAASMAWASFISSLGDQVPDIARQYNKDVAEDRERQRTALVKKSVQDILDGAPQVGTDVLGQIAGGMDPNTAQQVLARTSPEDKATAATVVANNVKGLSSLQTAPGTASAMDALADPQSNRHLKNAFVNRFMDALDTVESGGQNIGAHPRARNGHQAYGRFGVVPELHAQRVGLDPSKPEDLARFKADPDLQRAAAEDFVRELGKKYDWDPTMMRRGYYGLTSNPDAPQYLADGRRMPSSNEDNAKFLSAFGNVQRPEESTSPAKLPWDNSLLESIVKPGRPQMTVRPKKVTYEDKERYILSRIKTPEEFAYAKDALAIISGLAKEERDAAKDDRTQFNAEMTAYGENVRKNSQLQFDTWKTMQEAKERTGKARSEALAALKQQRESVQNQLRDLRSFEARVASGKESTDLLAAAFPEYYTTTSEGPSWFDTLLHQSDAKSTQVTQLDSEKVRARALELQQELNNIDIEISNRSGAATLSSPDANSLRPLSKYLTPRN